MSVNTNKRKKEQLGMPFGTAAARLRKTLLFEFATRLDLDTCFKCSQKIESVNDFTIEHKEPWLDRDPSLFWDLENIAFSHSCCNRPHTPRGGKPPYVGCGTAGSYRRGCRCDLCKAWRREKSTRERGGRSQVV